MLKIPLAIILQPHSYPAYKIFGSMTLPRKFVAKSPKKKLKKKTMTKTRKNGTSNLGQKRFS